VTQELSNANPVSVVGGRVLGGFCSDAEFDVTSCRGEPVRVMRVHGIGQQVLGEETPLREWSPELRDGLTRECGGRCVRR
jgi:hypothetical protein